MFEVEIGGTKVKAEVSFYTALLYEQEFGKDMVADFYGVQDSSPILSVDGEDVVKVDFTKVSWLSVTRVLWAAVKTADEAAPGYREWMRSTRGADTWSLRSRLDEAVTDCFFRSGAAEEEPEP